MLVLEKQCHSALESMTIEYLVGFCSLVGSRFILSNLLYCLIEHPISFLMVDKVLDMA